MGRPGRQRVVAPLVVTLTRSPLAAKKWRVTLPDGRAVDFGARGYSDYTRHGDARRMVAYLRRHGGALPTNLSPPAPHRDAAWVDAAAEGVVASSREKWGADGRDAAVRKAGFWSRWLLWSKPTLAGAAALLRRRFDIVVRGLPAKARAHGKRGAREADR